MHHLDFLKAASKFKSQIPKTMFKQFVDNIEGNDIYLITSLLIFFIFFVIVGLLLIKMSEKYVSYMSILPLNDKKEETNEAI
jgi:hypothetical protein